MKLTAAPSGWTNATIGEIAVEQLNNGIFRKNPDYLESGGEGMPVVWVEELFKGGEISTAASRKLVPTALEVKKYGLRKGDILFCRSSLKLDGIGYCNVYLGEDFDALFECHVIRISPDLTRVYPKFVNHLLRTEFMRSVIKSKANTSTMTTIDQKKICSIPICLPSVNEQRRIAAILDQAETLRTQRRAALTQLDSLAQSIFLEMFGDPVLNPKEWIVLQIGVLGSVHTGKTPPSQDAANFGGNIPFVTPGDLDGDLILTVRSVTEAGATYCKVVRPGTSLVSCIGNIGKLGIARAPTAFNQQINAVEWGARVNDTFGLAALEYARPQMLARSSATTLPILNKSNFSKVEIVVPPRPLQQIFATRIQAIESLKATHRAALAQLDALFTSLQQRAFAGEL